jgi:aminopeptidase YwaD
MSAARLRLLAGLCVSLMLAACARVPVETSPTSSRDAIAERLRADIAVLASDEFAGRQPGTPGEDKTLAYLERRMGEVGLVSGTGDPGSYWRMPVDIVATRPLSGTVRLMQGKREVTLPESDAAVFTPRRRALAISGPGTGVPVVFVGYGDGSVLGDKLAGAVAVMLSDPGRAPARREALFRQRATAVVTVVPDAATLTLVRGAESREKMMLASEEEDTLSAFVTEAVVADMLGKRRWATLKAEAEAADFAPLELNLAVGIEAAAERREFTTYNIVGMIPGTLPGSGAVLMLAHWDHLGECAAPEQPDRICNGAADNASGLAAMLELAQRLNSTGPFGRDIYVLATTSEEAGLLGARAFAKMSPVPLASIVAAFNFDMVAVAPAGSAVGFIGRGETALDPVILDHIAKNGRTLGDQTLADSFVQRQDGWALLQQGVPSVLLSSTYGTRGILSPFLATRYHRPSDSADAIELGGAIDDLLLHEGLIRLLADPARYPPPGTVAP